MKYDFQKSSKKNAEKIATEKKGKNKTNIYTE